MTIYIESFLIQNILINFCLLRLVLLICKPTSSFFRLCLASILGASFSVISSTCLKNYMLINLLKLVAAISMITIAFKQTKKQFVFNFILLFALTNAFAGAIISFSSNTYITHLGIITASKINLEIVTSSIIILTYIFELIAKHLKFKFKLNNFIYKTTLIKNGNKITINSFLDTGNLLNYNGNPVIIIDLNTFLKLNKINLIEFYLNKTEEIKLNTVTGSRNLKLFKLDCIIIHHGKFNKKYDNQYIAVNTDNCFKNTNYKALLSPILM